MVAGKVKAGENVMHRQRSLRAAWFFTYLRWTTVGLLSGGFAYYSLTQVAGHYRTAPPEPAGLGSLLLRTYGWPITYQMKVTNRYTDVQYYADRGYVTEYFNGEALFVDLLVCLLVVLGCNHAIKSAMSSRLWRGQITLPLLFRLMLLVSIVLGISLLLLSPVQYQILERFLLVLGGTVAVDFMVCELWKLVKLSFLKTRVATAASDGFPPESAK
jgi:hypothetical protein